MTDKIDITIANYVKPRTVPKSIPEGRVLVHNHVRHKKRTPSGINGFRAWTQTTTEGLVACDCGWSGLEHYRIERLRPTIIHHYSDEPF